jgi:hypothetical protein
MDIVSVASVISPCLVSLLEEGLSIRPEGRERAKMAKLLCSPLFTLVCDKIKIYLIDVCALFLFLKVLYIQYLLTLDTKVVS